MKVFACPDAAPFAEPDYRGYNSAAEEQREKSHLVDLADWLRQNGWTGERTGEVLRIPMADGYARYMLADGNSPALVHLPYGDAYHAPLAERLRYDEVIVLLDQEKKIAELFGARSIT